MDFKPEHFEEMSNGKYFDQGVHEVTITLCEIGKTQNDKDYVDVNVQGANGEEDRARMWFSSDKATTYTLNTLRSIFVHNAPESKKDEIRAKFNKIKNLEQLDQRLLTLIGKKCWFTVYENSDRTYVGSDGVERNSFDKNIYGYEPKPRPAQTKSDKSAGTVDGIKTDDGDDIIAF